MQGRQHEVTGQGGLDGDLRGLVVTDLTQQHHIRVASQNGAKRTRERQAGFRIHLHLVDALHSILDGVFDGDDVDLGAGDGIQGRVEGRRLARTGRTRDEDHAVRLRIRGLVGLEVALQQVQVAQRHARVGVVEDSHDDLLAPHGGEGRDAEVDLAAAVVDRHAAVLRLASLGDVDVAHDLEARDDTVLDALGRTLHRVKHAVDAVPHPHVVLGRLDVDVRGVVLDGLADQQVDEPHDGRVVIARIRDAECARVLGLGLLLEGGRQVAELVIRPDETVDRAQQIGRFGNSHLDLHPRRGPNIVDREDVAGVGHRQQDSAVADGDGQHRMPAADRTVDERDGRPVDGVVEEFDEGHVRLGRTDPRQLYVADRSAREQVLHGDLVGGRFRGHAVEVLDGQMAVKDQDLCHGRHVYLLKKDYAGRVGSLGRVRADREGRALPPYSPRGHAQQPRDMGVVGSV